MLTTGRRRPLTWLWTWPCLGSQPVRSLSRSATRSSNTSIEMHDSRICNESVSPWSPVECVAISGSRTSGTLHAFISREPRGSLAPRLTSSTSIATPTVIRNMRPVGGSVNSTRAYLTSLNWTICCERADSSPSFSSPTSTLVSPKKYRCLWGFTLLPMVEVGIDSAKTAHRSWRASTPGRSASTLSRGSEKRSDPSEPYRASVATCSAPRHLPHPSAVTQEGGPRPAVAHKLNWRLLRHTRQECASHADPLRGHDAPCEEVVASARTLQPPPPALRSAGRTSTPRATLFPPQDR